MNKIKAHFPLLLHGVVLVVAIINIYNLLIVNKFASIAIDTIVLILAIDGFATGIRYTDSYKNKKAGAVLLSLSSIIIFVATFLILSTLNLKA